MGNATVHKTTLVLTDVQTVVLPMHAEILCAREQRGQICIWYRCDPSMVVKQERQIAICGTGNPAPLVSEARYIGTAFTHEGDFVWHVFERLYLAVKS